MSGLGPPVTSTSTQDENTLLDQVMMEASSGPSSPYLLPDLETDRKKKEDINVAKQTLNVIGNLLHDADKILSDLEKHNLLGEAIIRRCQELADVVGNLVQDLEEKSVEDRKALAQACIEDVHGSTETEQSQELASLTENDILHAMNGAQGLLRDVESTLRSIERQEADEIADVAMTVARIFLLSLKSMYSSITSQKLVAAATKDRGIDFSGRFEILDGEKDSEKSLQSTMADMKTYYEIGQEMNQEVNGKDRIRVLWPPLGPAVMSACNWGKEEATKKPLLAVALGLTIWPAAVVTALVGTPVVLADAAIQGIYNSMSGGPVVKVIERGAAQTYHAARLTYLCSGLVARQSLRIASRQIERNGGVGQVAQNVAGIALDRALHPVETVQMTWNGFITGAGAVRDAAHFVQVVAEREMDKKEKASIL
uniref:Uncharacterized protein n=1 Tax=Cyclophora tenuis TaxID=216820 RepID=A0A7S1D4B8_CYCTE|mmetsp:Transcript_1878/g.3298  ORF Transcript_1878/g.3298 Transcript_1878/m.3298 type:complete len:426 (+) Transcript_1878:1300-2577(+)